MHFKAYKSAPFGHWGVALAHGDNLIEMLPNQWGRCNSISYTSACPGWLHLIISRHLTFAQIKKARLTVLNAYPTGQRRFGTPGSDAREEFCMNLAAQLNRDVGRWLADLEKKLQA